MELNPASASTQDSPKKTLEQSPTHSGHPRRFDRDTYNQITGLDARFLEAIQFDSRIQAKYSKTGARYSIKSEAYYAKVLGVCRETISNTVLKLERLGILDVTRRRPIRGMFQTNLYKIRSWIWWRLGKLLKGLRRTPHRAQQSPHKANPMRETRIPEEPKGSPLRAFTQEIMDRWKARGIWPDEKLTT
jgi:hypothetical protein